MENKSGLLICQEESVKDLVDKIKRFTKESGIKFVTSFTQKKDPDYIISIPGLGMKKGKAIMKIVKKRSSK